MFLYGKQECFNEATEASKIPDFDFEVCKLQYL